MKLVCTQSDLSTNLSLVSRAVPSRPVHPVLANILLHADTQTNQVSLTAFDLSLGIRTSFDAEVLEGGAIAIPAKLLVDITSHLPGGEVTLDDQSSLQSEAESEGLSLTITPKSGYFQIRAMESEEFPELPIIDKTEPIYISTASLIEGLKSSLFATSTDETKQVLTGVHFKIKEDTIEFAATDGHRLVVVETNNERLLGDDHQLEVTVPAKALRELYRMITRNSASDDAIALYLDQGQVVFAWQNQRLTTRTLDGQYPSYQLLIPRQFERNLTCDRKQLISTLERIAVLADQKNHIVKIGIDGAAQNVTLSCEAQDVGNGRESIPAQISGEDIEVAFNIKYLMEGLKELTSSEIQIHLNQALTPVIFTPLGGLKMTYLIMPVQLRN
jgi:DNA polymerase-3 subunit beta